MRFNHALLVVGGLLMPVGCSLSTLDLHDKLDLHRASFSDKLQQDERLTKQFLACTDQSLGNGTEPANQSLTPISALIQRIKESHPQQADSLLPVQTLFVQLSQTSDRRLDLDILRKVVATIQRWHAHLDFDEDDLLRDASRFSRLLFDYNKAYFGNVHFAAAPTPSGGAPRGVLKVVSNGFVDRGGSVFLFPGLSVEAFLTPDHTVRLTASAVESPRVSADLTRIFLEAFFDAAFQVPAVHGATALQSDGLQYPAFDADHPAISLDALARLTRDAMRAEAAVTAEVGKLVRGGSVFSSQNETLAASLETAAGVTAKKLIEHDGFCYFQVLQQSKTSVQNPVERTDQFAHVEREKKRSP
jgi:hypothetical protein